MPRQIADEEYAFLQGRKQVADFVESIWNDPALAKEAKALVKKKYPQLQIPDYDIETRVEQRLDKDKQDREERERKAREDEEDRRQKDARASTQKQYGFTDEAMGQLEQMMIERNIGDYEAGAMLMASRQPKASEPTFDSQYWNHDKQDGFAEIAKDPEAWGRGQIMNAIRADEERTKNGR